MVLRRHAVLPKRSFSQNFLVSRGAVESVARAVAPAPGEVVVELGPGVGTLTAALLREGARVIAVERDREMIAVLTAELGGEERLRVVEGDAAEVELGALATPPVAVCGNLPYAITGAIFRRLVQQRSAIARAVLMVQREVRDRLIAPPGTKAYGALTVFVQAAFEVKPVLTVPPGAFHPPPKVASAVVRLTPHVVPRADETEAFREVVRAAFETRRKTLRNALLQVAGPEQVDRALTSAHIDGKRRGETLSVEEFGSLAQLWRVTGVTNG